MKFTSLLFLILFCSIGRAQNPNTNPTIFTLPEQMAEFPGGDKALMDFIGKNLVYPKDAGDITINGRVIIHFTVTATGDITDLVVRRGLGPSFDREAIRVVSMLPKFIPAKHAGKPVSSNFLIPIVFSL
ncbi:MAG: energy transducer TonB [Chitinophagales bacterium]|nr:energy transducer TonB [Chitinophagales bacterium]